MVMSGWLADRVLGTIFRSVGETLFDPFLCCSKSFIEMSDVLRPPIAVAAQLIHDSVSLP